MRVPFPRLPFFMLVAIAVGLGAGAFASMVHSPSSVNTVAAAARTAVSGSVASAHAPRQPSHKVSPTHLHPTKSRATSSLADHMMVGASSVKKHVSLPVGAPPPLPPALLSQGKPVTILFFHGGGWVGGSPNGMEPAARRYRSLGYLATSVPYLAAGDGKPDKILHQIGAALMAVAQARAANPGGVVLAYGVSAGGTIAADLAAAGKVDGAVVVMAPTDLPRWHVEWSGFSSAKHWQTLQMNHNDLEWASPRYWLSPTSAPQYLLYGNNDPLVPLNQGQRYLGAAKRYQPDTAMTIMKVAGHEYPPNYGWWAYKWIHDRWQP